MKQSLQLRIGQSLTMTPQLQQAIKLLQMSTLDLQQEIQQALESNMMLEVEEEESLNLDFREKKAENPDQVTSEGSQTDMPDELPVDVSWDDVYESSLPSGGDDGDTPEFESFRSKSESLHDHLFWQLELLPISDRDYAIAAAIIDAINDDGYIATDLNDICQGLQEQLDNLEIDEVQAVLHMLQNFDPVGVAALDLADCLRLQLLQLPATTPYREDALDFVKRHLDLLATCDQARLIKRVGMTEDVLRGVLALIRTLDPKPGGQVQEVSVEYVVPDVFVAKVAGAWQVNLNPEIAPKLRINPFYSGMIKRADNSQDNVSMKNHLQEARWFIKSLHSRNDTLLRVARSIVEKQGDFFEHGAIAMKPMVLRDIAEELELHESTISRVTTQKYMHTPHGVIEFKYFFSSHVSTDGGGECSATAIRALIKELVGSENPAKPLSDSKISDLLNEKGINVARRTIAKYREAMSIPPTSQRKRLI
ncbi:RNA polymerase factor sigma-54 [Methylomonas sp. MED-D]|uniref:RNA polymerase factor sigma-54 n=1 Tax=unclassified Methylomonas TaxID=2608980 RepID=UPI0008DAC97A|nr:MULTISPECIES: RNA polymerase factor sigma-54 [unclassified Methylomonas]OHX35713.1 RNA polymerase factor sigma-54 [Methylomonas sp. LWB]WGS85921.1 RNA polymerase factor sigma-54 [Methylomonas sp. UP202]